MKRLVLCMLLLACGDDPKRPRPEGEISAGPVAGGRGGVPEGGVPGVDSGVRSDAGTCTDLTNSGSLIAEVATADPAPTASGGDAPAGTYELTGVNLHESLSGVPGPTGASYQITLRIQGTGFERVLRFQDATGPGYEIRATGTIAVTS